MGRLRKFLADRGGTLAVEMAMAMPVLFGLMLAGVEVTRYVLLNQKIERTSATMADLVAQSDVLSEAGLVNLTGAAQHVMTPYDVAGDGRIVVSSLTNPSGSEARIAWQRGFGAGAGASRFGTQSGPATLPDGFVVRAGENVIAVEVFYAYAPLLAAKIMAPHEVYNFALFRPRFGSLATLQP